jgi:MFS family permease
LTLALLMFAGVIQIWHILLLGLSVGLINAFEGPTRQSMVLDLVNRKEDLSNAIALNSAVFNGARLVGPSLGGILVAAFGESWCFLINGISYIAVIIALLMMTVRYDHLTKKKETNVLEELKEGFVYVAGYFPIRVLLIMVGMLSFFGMPFLVVIPAYVREILHGSSETLGFLMSFFGAGAFTAAIYMAARKSVLGLGKVLVISSCFFGAGLMAIAFVPWSILAYCIAFPAGFGLIASLASINTLLQTLADEDKRGRVMSFYSMGLIGMAPIGSMLFSMIEKALGLSLSVVFFGFICLCAALVFEHYRPIIRRLSRPAYVRQAIIVPEIAQGLQSTEQK